MRILFSIIAFSFFSIFQTTTLSAQTAAAAPEDAILGYWMTVENNLKIHVYKENGQFKATIEWFDEKGYKCKMNECTDELNPDPALRSRKILGLQVLSGLKYDADNNEWIDGKIYDSNTGNTYDSVVTMSDPNVLDVRGYYVFEWLGRSLNFYRVSK